MLRVARCARIRSCGLAEERKILFLELLELCRNPYIDGELTDCVDRCFPVGCLVHAGRIDTERLSDVLELCSCSFCVELHDDREHHRACDAVRCVIDCAQSVCHGMCDSETDIRVSHRRHILSKRHTLAAVRIICDSLAQVLADQLDRLEVETVGQLPCCGCCIAFNCMCQSIHTCGSRKASRHGGHHIRVDDCDIRDVVRVYADELSLSLNISYNVVDRRLSTCSARCRDSDREDRALLCRSYALKRADIREFRVVDDDADALACIHGRTAADRDHHVSARLLKCLNAVLNVLDRRIRLDIGIQRVLDAVLLEKIRNIRRNAELYKIRIGSHESFLKASRLDEARDLLDCAVSVIGNSVQDETIYCHSLYLLSFPDT